MFFYQNPFSILSLFDGLICAWAFTVSNINHSGKNLYKILNEYETIYRLTFIDRMILYYAIHSISLLNPFTNYNFILGFLSIPTVQNYITKGIYKYIKFFMDFREMFIKYNLSKFIIYFIENSDQKISRINNYNIFILYNIINFKFIENIFYNILFILLFNLLKSLKNTYYYYKAVKWAYYTNTGYKYNTLNSDECIYIINIIIKEKRWMELQKIEFSNAIVSLTFLNMKTDYPFKVSFLYNLYKFFSLWGTVAFLQYLILPIFSDSTINLNKDLSINTEVFVALLFLSSSLFVKKFLIAFILILCYIYNLNDFFITLVIASNKLLESLINELLFFIAQYKNINKMLEYTNKKNKQ